MSAVLEARHVTKRFGGLTAVDDMSLAIPEGVIYSGGGWVFEEYARGAGVASLGIEEIKAPAPPSEEEKKSILDLFKN